ncbi:hypothetical protein DYU05_09400 [Mucilaginibacter terrenus]|uniref:Glycosyltransferase n=1 Tax=Mucilaginibacter terrenus TaxID=2482727 RepID=A0A3E2NY59_9SPHI|nr:hypothetical protein [Mucilaginibacter terrenus]RFZ85790.1 hypothetical protein DYU05_09400 [Mucilaginibacter terrenus]
MDDNNSLSIVLICSSLEPGKDGVGDYSRRLAAELFKLGHECAVLSLNDRDVTDTIVEHQFADGVNVPVLRLSSSMEIKGRIQQAETWIKQLNPQWLSLQYVPFGYHPKGLKVGLSKSLLKLSNGRKWHIMFHELWVGIAKEESKKLQYWGEVQRLLIRSLITRLRPAVIQTNTKLYQQLINKLGFHADILPLFGNIPVKHLSEEQNINRAQGIRFVVFGAIHDRAPIATFAREAALYQKTRSIPVSLTMLGRKNDEQQRWAEEWRSAGLAVKVLGEQNAEVISAELSKANFGISATALAVIEKSGSFAAMREHGLPVISVSKPWTPKGFTEIIVPDSVVKYLEGNFESCISKINNVPYSSNISVVASQFISELKRG